MKGCEQCAERVCTNPVPAVLDLRVSGLRISVTTPWFRTSTLSRGRPHQRRRRGVGLERGRPLEGPGHRGRRARSPRCRPGSVRTPAPTWRFTARRARWPWPMPRPMPWQPPCTPLTATPWPSTWDRAKSSGLPCPEPSRIGDDGHYHVWSGLCRLPTPS